jgi:hypothetical protein
LVQIERSWLEGGALSFLRTWLPLRWCFGKNHTVITAEGLLSGFIACDLLNPPLRLGSKGACHGPHLVMLTGDNPQTAQVGRELGARRNSR